VETVKLFLADIRPLAEREAEGMALLTQNRAAALRRRRQTEDRLHGIAAGLLLRRVLGVREDRDLHIGAHGKPALTAGAPCFNLSHGGNWAVLAVFHAPVGVDLEPEDRTPIRIPRRYLLPEEQDWLERATPGGFAWLWTRLESALKADGRGLSLENRTFSVLEEGPPWHVQTFSHDGHLISCAAGEPFVLEWEVLAAKDLLI